ncbi:energy-coupling factor transporter transmembrane component T family protein [Paenactinomyces guangxiensis]|uniref:Energy-coupling factor transporter transmembrane protein EcfT n=1 Tax=Paenactinomyces guangxiensis TaxID=1490290 RepID=A0A7W1WQM9_9BACL|nr:energy-coupling factor transporter transmembrane component T [Paenactinomyces guangxiensis]MBA4494144.1 energy-coupling factor transporter transmembrane protein EcfT [Paenactinomyces guangxiensis]MBH8591111.1 energy-coupling factor transporter transmembrane protein EcfT [Paenactinomyces guangxiensis]
MKSLSLYVDRDSFVHNIDPISKIWFIIFSIAVPVILPTIPVSFVCMMITLSLLLLAKVFKQAIPVYGFIFLILSTVIIIQGLFNEGNETPLYHIGPLIFYREGFLYGLLISLRVINITGAFMLLVLTTKPSDLVEALVRKGLSPRLGYVLHSVFQIIPQMASAMRTIMDAQRSRGMETEGNLIVRIKAFLPLIAPVVFHSLINTKERALALEVRGFQSSGKKTFLNEEKKSPYSWPIQWGLICIIVAAIGWRMIA